jgi:hypothetical protein
VNTTGPSTTDADLHALIRETRRVVRHLQHYTNEQRADRAASHRLGPVQRHTIGEYFWTHPDVPGTAFDSRRRAALAGLAAQTKDARRISMFAAKFAADTVSAEPASYVEPTDANLSAAFAGCSRPPTVELYPEIRALFIAVYVPAIPMVSGWGA